MSPPNNRFGPPGSGPDLNGDTSGDTAKLTDSHRHPDLGLPAPPVLSPVGAAVVAEGRRRFRVVKPQVSPQRIGSPTTTGRLIIDLSSVGKDWSAVAGQFWPLCTARDNTEIIIKLPVRERVCLTDALRGWDSMPAVRFVIEHADPITVQTAVSELRTAIDTRRAELLGVPG